MSRLARFVILDRFLSRPKLIRAPLPVAAPTAHPTDEAA